LAESTGQGVLSGMEAALLHLDGEVDWPARRVVIQGLGKVGGWLAKELVERGASVAGCDLDSRRARDAEKRLGIERLEPDHVLNQECDVFSPNAMGGIFHDVSVNRARCRIVCGAANNVLAHEALSERLTAHDILLVPDFVVSCGALIRGAFFHLDGRRVEIEEIGRRVGHIVERVLDLAAERGTSPSRVAVDLADGMLRAARGGEPLRT
jgi:leucine dehydrogenase